MIGDAVRPRDAVIAILFIGRTLAAQAGCQSFARPVADVSIDVAPISGFVDVCGKDTDLCQRLTGGFPPGVVTLGYFVASAEWEAHLSNPSTNFAHYLIAQVAGHMTPADLPGFKKYVHTNNGAVPDHTELPAVLKSQGHVGLGVVDETDSSISFGTIMLLRRGAEPDPIRLIATNSAVVARGHLLSLYVYREMRDTADVSAAIRQTREWLGCVRQANGTRGMSR
jgi:hypothetical protein